MFVHTASCHVLYGTLKVPLGFRSSMRVRRTHPTFCLKSPSTGKILRRREFSVTPCSMLLQIWTGLGFSLRQPCDCIPLNLLHAWNALRVAADWLVVSVPAPPSSFRSQAAVFHRWRLGWPCLEHVPTTPTTTTTTLCHREVSSSSYWCSTSSNSYYLSSWENPCCFLLLLD